MQDDVPEAEKMRRFRALEELQAGIAARINANYLQRTVEVLIEERKGDRWKGRTRTNKLVFLGSQADLRGQTVPVHVQWTGPWSMIGVLAEEREALPVP